MAVTVEKDWTKVNVESIIPHRKPFLFIDYIAHCQPGESISAVFYVNPALPVFDGHFPDNPIFPGVLQIEAIAQATALTIMMKPEFSNLQPILRAINDAKFKKPIKPRDCLMIDVFNIEIQQRHGKVSGRAQGDIVVNEEYVALSADIVFIGMPKESSGQ